MTATEWGLERTRERDLEHKMDMTGLPLCLGLGWAGARGRSILTLGFRVMGRAVLLEFFGGREAGAISFWVVNWRLGSARVSGFD